jgi:hypothetical protein
MRFVRRGRGTAARAADTARLCRGRATARPRTRLPPGTAASSSPAARAASPERCTGGPAEGEERSPPARGRGQQGGGGLET